jgi:hypothetical protein
VNETEALDTAIDFLDAWCDQFDEEHEDYWRNYEALKRLRIMKRRGPFDTQAVWDLCDELIARRRDVDHVWMTVLDPAKITQMRLLIQRYDLGVAAPT